MMWKPIWPSPQVGPDHVEQLFARINRVCGTMPVAVDDVKPHMVFEHLAQQPVDGATTSGNSLENLAAVQFVHDGALDCVDLAAEASHAVDELFLLTNDVCHRPYPISVFLHDASSSDVPALVTQSAILHVVTMSYLVAISYSDTPYRYILLQSKKIKKTVDSC